MESKAKKHLTGEYQGKSLLLIKKPEHDQFSELQ